MPSPRLERAFFARDAESVARELLGQTLVFQSLRRAEADGESTLEETRVRIVETEAYVGAHDLACHASKGRTKRTEIMFGAAGHAYIYLIYGVYELLNVVTGSLDDAQAVLLRAAEPTSSSRSLPPTRQPFRGPGKLTRALGITRALNGADLCGETAFSEQERPSRIWFEVGEAPKKIEVSARLGVDYAGEWRDAPLRFYDPKSKAVSGVRPVRRT